MAWSQAFTMPRVLLLSPVFPPASGWGEVRGKGHLRHAANTAFAGVDILLGCGGRPLCQEPFPGSSRGSPGPQGSLRWQLTHLSWGTLPLFSSAVQH